MSAHAKLSAIEWIVVHHSASPRKTTLEDIDAWHRARRPPFRCVGYHFVIEREGKIRIGRPLPEMGAHVPPHNQTAIGICVVGDNTTPDPNAPPKQAWRRENHGWTQVQIRALKQLIRACLMIWPDAKVAGHQDVGHTPTACPGIEEADLAQILAA